MSEVEVFVSNEGTQYIWHRGQEKIVKLTDEEVNLIGFKVRLMEDKEILNRQSGNGISMGIPIKLNKDRLKEIKDMLVTVLKSGPFIDIETHVIDRLVLDSLLDEEDPQKRGWEDEEDVKNCVLTAKKVVGVRLNVNHQHPENTNKIKHLHPHLALVISGKKEDGSGRLVLVILNENTINVITIL
ncbi:hypothetical protein [Bacillus sp. RC51]|uniref:hypothetical protein n=1 Tax=Bacillus TaxID=1386 RepID=UPI0038378BBD